MEGQQQGQQEGQQLEGQQEGQQQEWHQQWQEWWLQWQGRWQVQWLQWQGQLQEQWQQWQQLQLPLQLQWEHWRLRWQQQFEQWHALWYDQWQQWQQRCQAQQHKKWWEWPQEQWQFRQWKQHLQQQWQQWQKHGELQWWLWQQQVQWQQQAQWQQQEVQGQGQQQEVQGQQQVQWQQQEVQGQGQQGQQQVQWQQGQQQQGQEPWQLDLHFQQWQLQWQQHWLMWHQDWQQRWRHWQQGQQQWREQRQWQWRQWQENERWQEQERWRSRRLTLNMYLIPVSYALSFKPLTTSLVFQDRDGANIPMLENTTFGNFVADGLVNEIIAAHRRNLSWAGEFCEDDLFVSEDERFVAIAKEPRKSATHDNQFLDLLQITNWFVDKYTRHRMMPPYLEEFVNRVHQIPSWRNERGRSASLWLLSNHPFFMGEEKWRLFVEEYYKWYNQFDAESRDKIIKRVNRNICPKWPLATVRDNSLLSAVYWNGRENLRPASYFTEGCNVPKRVAENTDIFRFSDEDGYLAVFQRTFYVHGLQILGGHWSQRDLALYISYIFKHFLPRFIERIYATSHEHYLFSEILDTYVKWRSASWRQIQGRLYEVTA